MFAWNCVEAGGKHLGTCIDRWETRKSQLIFNRAKNFRIEYL